MSDIYCCNELKFHASTEFNDVDSPIIYVSKFDEFGLKIMDGGSSYIVINYCPFCGKKLRPSKRDLWFDEVEKLGFENPLSENIPDKFLSDEWWKNK